MLLSGERLSVVHVSAHIALRDAVDLKRERIVYTIELGDEEMRFGGREHRRFAVCGLNPHAGEHGLFGKEDEVVIAPAIAEAQCRGIACEGPAGPDTAFLKGARGAYALIVAMYQHQGHIPMKLLNFEGTVNISPEIPIVRASVGHGTAFDIAGRNCADARNMITALRACAKVAAGRVALQTSSVPGRK
jgi:4-phospho-D-threonate 3-dehydrogenase / 4-phospho-D-erythronate 3-dehydrogenase